MKNEKPFSFHPLIEFMLKSKLKVIFPTITDLNFDVGIQKQVIV